MKAAVRRRGGAAAITSRGKRAKAEQGRRITDAYMAYVSVTVS